MTSEPVNLVLEERIQTAGYELCEAGHCLGTLTKFKVIGPRVQLDYPAQTPKIDKDGNEVVRTMCYLEFETDQRDTQGLPKRIRRYMVYSVKDPRHALRNTIEDWTGKPIEPDADGFLRVDIGALIGKSALLDIRHSKKLNGEPKHVLHKVMPTEKTYVASVAIDTETHDEFKELHELEN